MANIVSKIGKNLILAGVKRIIFVPWTKSAESGEWSKSETGFALDDVVADTTAISQNDPETNAVDCETRDEPIVENVTQGSYQFSCESANIDKDILQYCLGFTITGEGTSLKAYAPASYKEIWGEVEVQFENGTSMVLPKVKMNSKIDASSLKTGVVRGVISGTAYTTLVDEDVETPFYMSGSAVNTVSAGA